MATAKVPRRAVAPATEAEGTGLKKREIKAAVLGIRFGEHTLRWLEEVAEREGVSTSTLARMWILKRLSNEPPPSFAPDGTV